MSPALREGRGRTSSRVRILFVAGGALSLDVGTKVLLVSLLGRSAVGPSWLRIQVARNAGVAFGIGASASSKLILAVTLAIVVSLSVAAWRGWLTDATATGLILGGAVANLLDRAVDGTVVDLIDVGWWPTFNLADSFIVAGVGLLIFGTARNEGARHGSVAPDPAGDERLLPR